MEETVARVSIIIPDHNQEKTLGACPQAAYAETVPPFGVVVAGDCRTDSSRDVARRFPRALVERPTLLAPWPLAVPARDRPGALHPQ